MLIIGSMFAFDKIQGNIMDPGQFRMAVLTFTPFLVLLFSNIQEAMPFYREMLMQKPKRWVKVGMYCDAIMFLVIMLVPALPIPDPCVSKLLILSVLLILFVVVFVQLIGILRWRRWNHGTTCKNKEWVDSEPMVFEVEIAPVNLDSIT
jgi:hypothetical protein